MSAVETARPVLGIVGNAISFLLFLSPLPSMRDSTVWKSTRDYSMLPYLLTFFNCVLWIFYAVPAVHPHSLLVLTINSVGAAFELIYICIFIVLAPTHYKRRKRLGCFVVLLILLFAIVVVVLKCWRTQESRAFVVGVLSAILGTCMYAAPLIAMKRVIQTRSVEFMPFWLSLASFLNALVWTAYATLHLEIFVMIPNGLGIVLGACQLVLYGTYHDLKADIKLQPAVDVELQLPAIGSAAVKSNQPSSVHKSDDCSLKCHP